MGSKAHLHQLQGKLARLVIPALEKVIKNSSWRKHTKIVAECKAVIEWFSKPVELQTQEVTVVNGSNPYISAHLPGIGDSPVKGTTAANGFERPGGGGGAAGVAAAAAGEDSSAAVAENGGVSTESITPGDSSGLGSGSAAGDLSRRSSYNGRGAGGEDEAATVGGDTAAARAGAGGGGLPPAPVLFEEGNRAFNTFDTELIMRPLFMACDTLSVKMVDPALDCMQRMIAHGHLRGEMDVGTTADSKTLISVMDSICKCYDMADENIELLVLKSLLSAVTSSSLRVHGECLLKAVRTCYNIFLGSKAAVNQQTAKASLTQMIIIVFRRMEADSSTVPVHPIVVADLMEPAERSVSDTGVTQFVQTFITRVVQDIEVVLTPNSSLKNSKHDGAFDATAVSENSQGTDVLEGCDRDMLDARYWEINMYRDVLGDREKGGSGRRSLGGEGLGSVDGGAAADTTMDSSGGGKSGDGVGGENAGVGYGGGDFTEFAVTNKLRRDAFLVFRALCKLSMKAPPQEGNADPFAVRGKIVALELLKILLENAGAVFRTSERFVGAIKQYLCLSLLKNSSSSLITVFQLSCSILMSLVSRFRAGLKAEIGVFFPMIVLRVLENVAHPNYQQKMIVLRFLEKLCVDPQVLVDVFVNYDCDLESSNIFERMVNGLLKTAQGVSPGIDTSLTPQQDTGLKLAALKILVGVLRSMGNWMNRQLRLTDVPYMNKAISILSAVEDAVSDTASSFAAGAREGDGVVEDSTDMTDLSSENVAESSEVAQLEQRRAYKLELQEGINRFNKKPKKGLEYLIKSGKIDGSPEGVVEFLKSTPGLDKVTVGEYLGEMEEFCLKVMHAYVDSCDFSGMGIDDAIRKLVVGFRPSGESQKIDRLMEKLAERYCKCNPKAFTSADTAYVLAYSVIMLNTDAHNPMVKIKMSKAEFIRNNRGIDDGNDLPEEVLSSLYDRIVKNEIKMKVDMSDHKSQPSSGNKFAGGLDSIISLVIRRQREVPLMETSEDVIRHMQETFRAKAGKSRAVYYEARDVEVLRPMVEVVWAPMLAAFSVPLDNSDDEVVTFQCLEGFRHAIHITSVMCMDKYRDAFITSLAKFTSLHSAADIKQKNIDAIKALVAIADEDGNYLQEAWEHILTCVSRFEHLHLIGEGVATDGMFFSAPQSEMDKARQTQNMIKNVLPALPSPIKKKGGGRFAMAAANAARRGSYDSAGVGGHAAGIVTSEQMNNLVQNLNMLEQIDSFEMNRIFTRSERLNGGAIVDFVKALCKVSLEELKSQTEPRVFSLTKIVEISHFNMKRIRLVWSRIWSVLSDYFVTVGCMENLSVAMYAVDSLRQLAMKFLERDELANYNFQNEFLKPFSVVMRKSSAVEIRELIIRCVSQMVFARVANVKSGWKTMFMVFTTAASDDQKNIVLLAFTTIEKIVRDYFPYITETETTTFTDCVNCLIAFTNSRFSKDVSIDAIKFLRFCAVKLAEGELGKLGKEDEIKKSKPVTQFTDKDDHVYFWFPLLAGLSELTFDPRPEIRKDALEVLFDTLRFHGHLFSPALWERVFDSVLFPIFDYVRRATEPQKPPKVDQGAFARVEDDEGMDMEPTELEMDAWLYETCTLALQLVVDLFVKFYPVVSPLLGRILGLLTGFIKRPHQSLAAIGVAAFVRLMSNAGELFSDEKWHEVLLVLQDAVHSTLPNVARIVGRTGEDHEEAAPGESHPSRTLESAGEGSQITTAVATVTGEGGSSSSEDGESVTQGEMAGLSLQQTIIDVRCRTAVQLLLVQAMTEIYNNHWENLSMEHATLLLDTLHMIAAHAHGVNMDRTLRTSLHQLRMVTQLPDPPLLRLESESFHAYLTLLQRLPADKPSVAHEGELEVRLVELCEEVLLMYVNTATIGIPASMGDKQRPAHWTVPLGSARRRELTARAPLVVATLRTVAELHDQSFEQHLLRFFPLLTQLIGAEHGSAEVQSVLSQMFAIRIAPMLGITA
ncbi:hypothetical protein CBR_g8287 [Chara braunii]|uniref:SEC7 domain-containing protein n=1 Tax=Chara braunii TaxID=69332 RepID=A0A388KLS2_CHABU|nr:hypothetical protein CBR_g8287 [Chara braunii]|eukprot:GBG70987.1 hypothetical protein CBR_g8287 [Chara braunii]